MPANFRTYEGQSRLLTAVIAAHPGLKLNYKEIANHYGSDWTESGIEHFFRPIKKNAKAVQDMVKRKEDPANFNHQAFQFRQIKKEAENMRQGKGGPSTPTATTPKTPKTTGGRKRTVPPSTGKSTATKRIKHEIVDFEDLDVDELEALADKYNNNPSNFDFTPTKSRTKPIKTPTLEHTQATAASDDDDDLQIITPCEPPTFSFAQANTQHSSTTSDDHSSWDFYSNATKGQHYADDEFDDEC